MLLDDDEPKLSHVAEDGAISMVDVGAKDVTRREAVARGLVKMSARTLDLLERKALPKGDVLSTAKVAGILAAKRTSTLIPLTHPLAISYIEIAFELERDRGVQVTATVRCEGKTGVEIEAMTACAIASLTIYDMCKSAERGIVIEALRLIEKSGGKSGTWTAE